ncbi:amino acid adenylation domain protein [Hysterangium stoloniferum]|nr:amino acid adenylation domain protein [Hysterangium stoloniferum]
MSGPEPALIAVVHTNLGTLPAGVAAIYPMTRSQEGLWLDYSFAPHRTHNNLTLKLTVTHGEVTYDGSLSAIHDAIGVLTQRHSILRSTFHEPNGVHKRPFVAEHDPTTATPTLHIVRSASAKKASEDLLRMLRRGVDLSSEFAMRWYAVVAPTKTELYIVSHHIALDGSSMSQLSVEFFDILSKLKNGSSTVEAPPTVPFSQAHAYEAAFASSKEYEQARRFWLGQLAHTKPIQWKSESLGRSATKSYRAIQTWKEFSKAELAAWGNRFKTSWFRVALGAIGILVRSNSAPDHGSDQNLWVAFGGRPAGFENVVGHFVNALPIRVPYAEVLEKSTQEKPPQFDSLVRLVSQQVSAAKKHERMSILDISKASNTMGAIVNKAQVAVTLSPKLSRSDACLYPVEGPYELLFCFLEAETSVSLGVIYDPTLFSEKQMEYFKTQFFEIQQSSCMVENLGISSIPGAPLPHLYPGIDFNDVPAISASRFHLWFEEQAARNPALIALYSGEKENSMSYKDLNEAANRIAHYLKRLGIGRGDMIVLHIARNFTTMIWILAVLKSGAAYGILDQGHPLERNRAAMSVAEPSVFVDDGGNANSTGLLDGFQGVRISTVEMDLSGSSSHNPVHESADDDLAYIVFTSGSTGKPKGVEIEHRNLAHFVADSFASKYVNIGPGSRVLQFATFSFDAAVFEWSLCLSIGATLCFSEHPKALVGDYLADVIDANEVTFMHVTPSVLATLPVSRSLSSLRQISVGGEMVPAPLINAWRSRVQVQNGYGPTETCVPVVISLYAPKVIISFRTVVVVIGVPHRHTKFYVSNDAYDRILPIGEIGEVCIGGPQVGRGYRGLKELTASRFAVHPEIGERLYRTGDRGVMLPNGAISLVGRIDREVKVRGYRIELEAVERTISNLIPDITGVSVQVTPSGTALCAFICPESINGDLVRSRLAKELPNYMVPTFVYTLPKLPLNTNDKVDHKTIKAQMENLIAQYSKGPGNNKSHSHVQKAAAPPIAPPQHTTLNIENDVIKIWQNILGLSSLPGLDKNFFDLGGNSLAITRLLNGIKLEWPTADVRLVDLFHNATIDSQVALILPSLTVQSARESPQTFSNVPEQRETPEITNSEIAIIGLAGRFPGADNADDLYRLFMDQREGFTTFSPPEKLPFKDAIFVPQRGAISQVQYFDHSFWGLKEDEARDMDPQTRLFMETTLEALEDAGHAPSPNNHNDVGLCVGSAHDTWQHATEPVSGDDFQKTHRAILSPSISARTAYHLNLHGPNVTLNTACSSGVVALSLAIDHLRSRQCDISVAGGVSIAFPQDGYITKQGQIFSPSGHCRPFDSRADGTLPADGVCALVLRRLSDAVRDGDRIYSVISGVAIGSDGRTDKAGYSVPSPRGQSEVIKRAWQNAGIDATRLTYAELHGSGTAIGDALELEGLTLGLSKMGATGVPCAIGSNKGNLGNCEAASGLVSLIKLCKSIQHDLVPPIQSFGSINPMINPTLSFKIAAHPTPLSDSSILSVSSLGLGGVNAHVVLRYPPAASRRHLDGVRPARHRNLKNLDAPGRRPHASKELLFDRGKIIALCASQLLSIDIEVDTDLRAAGLDSNTQIRLTRMISDILGSSSLK